MTFSPFEKSEVVDFKCLAHLILFYSFHSNVKNLKNIDGIYF